MRVAVTGASGIIGQHVMSHPLATGHTLLGLDVALPPSSSPVSSSSNITYATIDLLSYDDLLSTLREHNIDAIISLAGIRRPGLGIPDSKVFATNTQITYNVLQAAGTLGISRVVLASSVNAIGGVYSTHQPPYAYFPIDELHPAAPEDPYSLSKHVGEEVADAMCRRFSEYEEDGERKEGMRVASLRFHLCVDENEAAEVIGRAENRNPRDLWGWVRLSEAARACWLAITAERGRWAGHGVFLIASTTAAVRKELGAKALRDQHWADVPVREGWWDDEEGKRRSYYDCAKAKEVLGWEDGREAQQA